jgi:hypothetical protein
MHLLKTTWKTSKARAVRSIPVANLSGENFKAENTD